MFSKGRLLPSATDRTVFFCLTPGPSHQPLGGHHVALMAWVEKSGRVPGHACGSCSLSFSLFKLSGYDSHQRNDCFEHQHGITARHQLFPRDWIPAMLSPTSMEVDQMACPPGARAGRQSGKGGLGACGSMYREGSPGQSSTAECAERTERGASQTSTPRDMYFSQQGQSRPPLSMLRFGRVDFALRPSDVSDMFLPALNTLGTKRQAHVTVESWESLHLQLGDTLCLSVLIGKLGMKVSIPETHCECSWECVVKFIVNSVNKASGQKLGILILLSLSQDEDRGVKVVKGAL
ncbi:uncharacterized protein LOC119043969 [Artibeus jamaicensis]|uniref:uncharacterized protein LOC119043969 n=1 Tax=Artibeus jamaicensis TaxID=9417 RepID=UPI00235AD182|nr:uncharacterized protein LOC119043969 [Artibeus jamaicensis]